MNSEQGSGPEIVLIAAVAANRVIGRDGTIPWSVPGEQARFREITMGHPLIMGRRTFESIGRPLPGRRNIVVSRNPGFRAEGATVAPSLEAALNLCDGEKKVFLIGGEALFAQGLGLAHTLILSELDFSVEGDVFFPEFSSADFCLVSRELVQGEIPWHLCVYRALKR